jgi:phage-related protein
MTIAVANTCLANVVANGAVTITASNSLAVAATAYIAQVCGYTGTLLPGDVLEIDCDKMTVKLNGADSRRYWTGRFPKLYVGTNEVRYADDEAARTVALDEEHDPRWL